LVVNDAGTRYARAVVAGKVVVGRWVRLACERHLCDLKRSDLHYDAAAAKDAIEFFKHVLRLNGGEFEGKPFVLQAWEAFIIASVFGWKQADGYRRFNWVYCEIGKGNGKSPIAAGVGLKLLAVDNEMRAEIYSAAADKEQAKVLFRDAVAMVEQSPHLSRRIIPSGVGENVYNLAYPALGSWFRPWSKERRGKSGFRPHGALIDELHEHADSTLVEMLREGFKGRRQPLLFEITNAGFDRRSVCWQHHEYAGKVLKRLIENDRLFAYVCGLDSCAEHFEGGHDQPVEDCEKCDDFRNERVWLKANPNLGVSIRNEYLRDRVREADDLPATRNTVLRLNFCQWTQASARFIPANHWRDCGGAIDYERLRGRRCIGGLDLANSIDLAAFGLLFLPDNLRVTETVEKSEAGADEIKRTMIVDEETGEFDFLAYFWIPGDNVKARADRDRVPYDVWTRQGLIEATPGNIIDYSYIKQKIAALAAAYKIEQIGYDPWNAMQIAVQLQDVHGLKMVEVRQGYRSLSEPTTGLLRLVMAHKLRHGGNAVLSWMADNLVATVDPAGNRKPDRDKSTEKIDGMVALIISLAVAIREPGVQASVYESRGVLRC